MFPGKDFVTIGKGGRLAVAADGIVRFKIRDDEGGMADNRGSVTITIRPAK